jgi:hypothetical protein
MAIPFRLKDEAALNALAEPLREHYRKNDDGSYDAELSELPDGYEVASFKGLKSSLQKERDNAKTAAARVRELEQQLQGAGDETLRAELDTLRSQNAESQQRLQKAIAANAITAAITAAKGNSELLTPIIEKRSKVDDDGKLVVLDDAGKPRGGVTVADLVKEMSESGRFDGAFAGTGQSGGGSTATDISKGGRPTLTLAGKRRSQLSYGERARLLQELGSDAYHRLPY